MVVVPPTQIRNTRKEKILLDAFEAVVNTDSKAVSSAMLEKGKSGKEIGEAIRVARIDAIRNVLKERP